MATIISNSTTEISEETVLTSATASECATASASVTTATSRPTRTLAKKLTVQVSFGIFFQFWPRFKWTPSTGRLLLTAETGEFWTTFEVALRNAHFRYRGSIEYRDTRDGIVIAVPISGIAQHYTATPSLPLQPAQSISKEPQARHHCTHCRPVISAVISACVLAGMLVDARNNVKVVSPGIERKK